MRLMQHLGVLEKERSGVHVEMNFNLAPSQNREPVELEFGHGDHNPRLPS
jgi:hypothetical protein